MAGTQNSPRVPLSELADRLEKHSAERPDGDREARVGPDAADRLADPVAEDMGLLHEEA
jgi:hypothetical protein